MTFLRFNLFVVCLAGWLTQQQTDIIDFLMEENRTLHDLLGKQRPRLNDSQRRRLAAKAKPISREVLDRICSLVTPDTLRHWHRLLIPRKYDGSRARKPGRPPVMKAIKALIMRLAKENSGWGYTRIKGAWNNLGHQVGRSTILRTLQDNGIDPAPERGRLNTYCDSIESLEVCQLCPRPQPSMWVGARHHGTCTIQLKGFSATKTMLLGGQGMVVFFTSHNSTLPA